MIHPSIHPYIGCLLCVQNDWGGQRTLQRKWTSFLKARMVCSVPEYELHLNVLRSVFVLQGRDAQSSVFYGIFGLEWYEATFPLPADVTSHQF